VYAFQGVTDRWATFDCYGTLIDWNSGIRGVLQRLWPEASAERLLERYHAIEPLVQAGEGRGLAYREVGARTLRAIGAVEALPVDDRQVHALADSLPSWPAFAEVPAALAELTQTGWRLAILSNTDPDLLAASVKHLGVTFDELITAKEAGSYKPAHGHWQQFFQRTAADRAHHVHVGASPFHDLAPANEIGLTCVWINRLDERSAIPRAAELPDLADLPATLERLVPARLP
jgi:2-haloacid dehalogenase